MTARQQVETWVPVKGTERTLLLACDGDVSSIPATAMKGLYKAHMGPINGLREDISDLSHFQGPLDQALVTIAVPSKYRYIREHDLDGAFLRGIRWNALLWLIPGGCIISAALYFSAKE